MLFFQPSEEFQQVGSVEHTVDNLLRIITV